MEIFYRKINNILEKWKKDEQKRALLIDGARQIGKTTTIREFAKKQYNYFIEINFLTNPEAKNIFDGDLSAEIILKKLSAYISTPLVPYKTLIFFDEVQECPNVRTAIKFLVEDKKFDYIESGSLLGINYHEIKSYAVGFEDIETMYPMDFEEFAIATGVQPEIFKELETAYRTKSPVDSFIHNQFMKIFTAYMIVGGMPAAINTYIQKKDFKEVYDVQAKILKLYRNDIQKYSQNDKTKITTIFNTIPSELNKKNKRFMLSDIASTARMERYESCFNWLTDAGVGLPCYNLAEVKQPVEINKKRNLFKYFFCDTGLLCALCSKDLQYRIVTGDYQVNSGSILENVIAQNLMCNGFSLYYFDNKNIGEVDFIIEQLGELIPVEVKSGSDYRKHHALTKLMNVPEYQLKQAIVFCTGNVECKNNITYLPLYMIMFFRKEDLLDAATEVLQNMDFAIPPKLLTEQKK